MLTIGEPLQTQKGTKSATLKDAKGQPIKIELRNVKAPFGASVFGGDGTERRVNLDAAITDIDLATKLTELDQQIIKAATQASEKLFKKTMSSEDVIKNYKPILRPHEVYDPKVRTKVSLDSVKVYDNSRKIREIPENKFRNAKLSLFCGVPSLWLMANGAFGALVSVEAILYDEVVEVCPFTFDE